MKLTILLILLGVFKLLEARGGRGGGGRGGGGRGGGGRGRGSSGARSSSRGASHRGSFRTGSSQYHSGFRQNIFHTRATPSIFRTSTTTSTLFIISPRMPILYGSHHYYWRGHYVTNSSIPQQCEYDITDEDQELRNVTYSNGTLPQGLTFGCTEYQDCCGLECCNRDFTAIFFVFALLGVVLLYKCAESFCSTSSSEHCWMSFQQCCCGCCLSSANDNAASVNTTARDQNHPFLKTSDATA